MGGGFPGANAGVDYVRISELDEVMAHGSESPQSDGLQGYRAEQVNEIVSWVKSRCVHSSRANAIQTSEYLARKCSKHTRGAGFDRNVTNLAMKTAMALCGFRAVVVPVEFQHYRMTYTDAPPAARSAGENFSIKSREEEMEVNDGPRIQAGGVSDYEKMTADNAREILRLSRELAEMQAPVRTAAALERMAAALEKISDKLGD